jgi:hypothetical protein
MDQPLSVTSNHTTTSGTIRRNPPAPTTHFYQHHPVPPPGPSLSLSSSSTIGTIEISPGLFATIRGADETRNAIEQNFVIYPNCMSCNMNLTCIADADYVLCPECKVISPSGSDIESYSDIGSSGGGGGGGGVGLGVRTR